MKRLIHTTCTVGISLLLVLVQMRVHANAAQPGVWNAGGTVFTMLYPEDSLTFKKVQMEQERIYIQLYKGYAVVKGTYIFRNTTKEKLDFKMGYPINGMYAGGGIDLNQVTLDSLSRFKIKAGNRWLPLLEEAHPELNNDYRKTIPTGDNWMVWQMAFSPEESQSVDVYFIVNTNEAGIRNGYNNERRNAFIYLLESGSVWHQPIEQGSFHIQLMDGLTPEDIKGLSPGFGFRHNETHRLFVGEKTNFSPTPKDNLVVTYHKRNDTFSFDRILVHSEELFSAIDELSAEMLDTLSYTDTKIGDPYDVESTFLGGLPGLLTLFVSFAPLLIVVLAVAIAIWAVVKWIRIKKEKNRGV